MVHCHDDDTSFSFHFPSIVIDIDDNQQILLYLNFLYLLGTSVERPIDKWFEGSVSCSVKINFSIMLTS